MTYKTITAIDNQEFQDKLNNCVVTGFELYSWTIHPFSGWYIGVLVCKQ